MIDLKNRPVGATHYDMHPVRFFKYSDDKRNMYYFIGGGWVKLSHWPRAGAVFKILEWSIHNNDKPLSELSDEQRGLLFNHRCNGGDIETESSIGWMVIKCPQWIFTSIYRAKQKTERELFIDEWSSKIATNAYNGGNVRSLVGQMFDDVNMEREGGNGHQ